MILGVDIGGTKTLLGLFDSAGAIIKTSRFETPKSYKEFLVKFSDEFQNFKKDTSEIIVAAPGRIDKKNNLVIAYGNLPWKNTPLKGDIENITKKPVEIENDAKLAALTESIPYSKTTDKILYITFSTGIGVGLVYKGRLDEGMLDSEAGQMILPNPDKGGELERWEDFASGRALFAKYGKKASELNDKKAWDDHTAKMAIGIVELAAVIEPDMIIVGGGVGTHFNKYGEQLLKNTLKLLPKMVKKPLIIGANNAELASLQGCYELSRIKNG